MVTPVEGVVQRIVADRVAETSNELVIEPRHTPPLSMLSLPELTSSPASVTVQDTRTLRVSSGLVSEHPPQIEVRCPSQRPEKLDKEIVVGRVISPPEHPIKMRATRKAAERSLCIVTSPLWDITGGVERAFEMTLLKGSIVS